MPGWIFNRDYQGKPARPLFRCQCGALLKFGGPFKVYTDGTLNSPVYHDCGFGAWVVLDDYDGPAWEPEK